MLRVAYIGYFMQRKPAAISAGSFPVLLHVAREDRHQALVTALNES